MMKKQNSLNFIYFKDYTWLNYSTEGYFDIHHALLSKVSWFDFQSASCFPFDYIYNEFFEPNLISLSLSRKLKNNNFNIGYYLKIPSLKYLLNKNKVRFFKTKKGSYACFSNTEEIGIINLRKNLQASGLSVETADKDCALSVKLPNEIELNLKDEAPGKIYNLDSGSKVKGKLYYASVGIGKYNSGTNLPELKSMNISIDQFSEIFTKHDAQLKNVFDSVFYWHPLKDSDATKSNITNYLLNILMTLKEDDALVLYISGHGIIPPQGEIFNLLPYDANLESNETILASSINSAAFVDFIRYSKSKKIIIILDACQSGGTLESIAKISKIRGDNRDVSSLSTKAPSINLFASSGPYDLTFSSESEGSHLVNALSNAINELLLKNKVISVNDLQYEIENKLKDNSNSSSIMITKPNTTFNFISSQK